MAEPTGCALWNNPEVVATGNLAERFELLKTFERESHFWRYLLECRECGQLYFYEFYEETDWLSGNDPQFSTWVPVRTGEEAAVLENLRPLEVRSVRPCLLMDWPKDAAKPKLYWARVG